MPIESKITIITRKTMK